MGEAIRDALCDPARWSRWAADGLVNASDATHSDSQIVLATDPENPPQIMQDTFRIWNDFSLMVLYPCVVQLV